MAFCHFSLGLATLRKGYVLAIQCKNLSVICDGNKCRKSGRDGLNHIPLAPWSPGTHYLYNIYELLCTVYIHAMPRSSTVIGIPTVRGAVQSQQCLLRFQGFTKGKVKSRMRCLRDKMMRHFSSAWKPVVSAFQNLSITELWWKITLLLHSINKVLT